MILRAGPSEIIFPRRAMVMGIVNVTPDSFSDGGQFLEPGAASDHAFRLVEEGAEIIDIGGESTRPHAEPVSEAEELRRVLPVLGQLTGRLKALISVDTYKPRVAREALAAGASIVNDTGANREEPAMWEIVAGAGAGYIAMHMQGTPATMQDNPSYADVCQEVGAFFADRLRRLKAAGVAPEQIVLDVGIGFGKQPAHNLGLLRGLEQFKHLGRPQMIGVSRKSFLGIHSRSGPSDRLPEALACACWAVQAGVQIIRTHDAGATLRAIRMMEEILGDSEREGL